MTHALQRSWFLLVLAFTASGFTAACGGDTTNTTIKEDPLVIDAKIEGTVIDGITRAPIEGATVTVPGVLGAMGTFTTDTSGFYSIAVPGVGTHTVFVEAAKHARAKYSVNATTEPGASGNISVTAVRNSTLYPTTGTLSGRVTSGGNRDIVGGATILVQLTDTSDPIEDASLKVSTKTSKTGQFSLTGLPAGSPQTRVTVLPADLDGDGSNDTATFSNFVTGGPGGGVLTPDSENFMDIVVDQFIADKVLSTNLDDDATIATDGTLVLTYAQPMVDTQDATLVNLFDGITEVGVDTSWADGVELTITPKAPLLDGHFYTLSVDAKSVAGNAVAFDKGFSVTSNDAPADAVSGIEVVDTDPILWNTKTITLAWDPVTGAEGYRVFARNNQFQTSWAVLFDGLVSQFDRPHVKVTLPDSFDTFPSDDVFSAVGFATTVEFAVQAFNGRNDGPFDDTSLASFSDTVCPHIAVASANITDNTVGMDVIKAKYLLSSIDGEPLADNPAPKFTFAAGLGADALQINPRTMNIRRLRADQFEVSFDVPVGTSGVGDLVTVDLKKLAVTDTSGNGPDGTPECPNTIVFNSN